MLLVQAANHNAVLVESKSKASTRMEYTIRDAVTWAALGATSITTAGRAWIYAAQSIQKGQ